MSVSRLLNECGKIEAVKYLLCFNGATTLHIKVSLTTSKWIKRLMRIGC